jgi:UDP-N-acetylglucosamine diphosphorylase / glucose-1-phosphate thymidylyltransferase / UDP-N-acetylgalactosamine diphosphorylase / glucosamine-1-phosphate N-acetyltransferase / galactosamine-1-phosphate N-acetyltransferase
LKLILLDIDASARRNFDPVGLSRPLFELRCGITNLAEKLIARTQASSVACFIPEYLAAVYSVDAAWPVNDMGQLAGDDLLLVNSCVKADSLDVEAAGPSEIGLGEDGTLQYIRVRADDLGKIDGDCINSWVDKARETLPSVQANLPMWNYAWDLMLANPDQLTTDFVAIGASGIEGSVEQPNAIRGSAKDVFIAPGAVVHPMVVFDAEHGPIYIDENVEIHPFTRIEGPCYVGKNSILLGAKCREGNSIGPFCRIGGEIEESIIQGYSNKYHDGFLGHAYVGEWVNLGAMTTNSDLKNDYGSVAVVLDGARPIDTGSNKVGSLIGDHTKTSIGTLFNTGSMVGAMALIMATGEPLPKFIPSFAWFLKGVTTKGFGRKKLYGTARTAMGRRGKEFTDAHEAMFEEIFELTAGPRLAAIQKGRKQMAAR